MNIFSTLKYIDLIIIKYLNSKHYEGLLSLTSDRLEKVR